MTILERSPAEERLLDAALVQVMVGHAAGSRPVPHRRHGYLAAAVLALAAVVGTQWLAGRNDRVPAVQDQEPVPETLPKAVIAHDVDALATLSVDLQNLVCELRSPAELEQLRRFQALRRLVLRNDPPPLGGAGPSGPRFWLDPKPEALAPLATLPELRELHWPRAMRVQGKHIEALAPAPQLRSLVLPEQTRCGDDLVPALAKLSRLESLRLESLLVPAPLLAALATLPLRRLEFIACAGLDDNAFRSLQAMRSLVALAITHQNGGSLQVDGVIHGKGPLTASSFAAIAALPALRELDLEESELRDELLQELPARLHWLNLGSRHVDFAVASGLRRLGELRDLAVGAGVGTEAAERMVDVLGTLHLTRLEYRGVLTADLLAAIARQPDLTTLAIQLFGNADLTPLADAPKLRSIEVLSTYRYKPSIEDLAPLARCRHLRSLRLVDCALDVEAVRAVVGEAVVVEVETLR
ncbi:MAG: hypothetical protein WAT39_10570 [Planctomycetota bacterium]